MTVAHPHQYLVRNTRQIVTERLAGDRALRWLYAAPWEEHAWLLRAVTSSRTSHILGLLTFDLPFRRADRFAHRLGIDLRESVAPPETLDTPRKIFTRQIRYWDLRPMEPQVDTIVSPADSRLLLGSFAHHSGLFLKGKFFEYDELLGEDRRVWLQSFHRGDYVICRLTPEHYHYNHLPVSGIVRDVYQLSGRYHSCNPAAVIAMATPYSKNMRVVTIIDTDVPNGSGVGLVAMIEIVALMIGQIDQCYSRVAYDTPTPLRVGQFARKGQPKSLFRPGSSTTVLIFQPGRVRFCDDLLENHRRPDVDSRFSRAFGHPLVETNVQVRSTIGYRVAHETQPPPPQLPLWEEEPSPCR